MKVCIVTEELANIEHSGGIGTAFHELALCLGKQGYDVTLLYVGAISNEARFSERVAFYREKQIILQQLDFGLYVWTYSAFTNRSYAVFRYLADQDENFDVVHFADYRALGFYSIQARKLGAAFRSTRLVVQAHGPTRWTAEANGSPLVHHEQILIDYMEKSCFRGADYVISPSQYLLDWLSKNRFVLDEEKCRVIRNLSSDVRRACPPDGDLDQINEIIMFGRHEPRKGLTTFIEAINALQDQIYEKKISVTFLGRPSLINHFPSEAYITQRGRKWKFKVEFQTDYSRDRALRYLASRENAIVVVPSSAENSPYTVLESLQLGKPTISSSKGGASELYPEALKGHFIYDGSAHDLGRKLQTMIDAGAPYSKPSTSNEEAAEEWNSLHQDLIGQLIKEKQSIKSATVKIKSLPKVVLGITHFERPEKLMQAVYSAIRQTYKSLEIVVVDDGSASDESAHALAELDVLLARVGGKLIRQENQYLGAARNTIARETSSDYIIFLDDDDLAMPRMVEDLVNAATLAPNTIIAPLHLTMEEARRGEALTNLTGFKQKMVNLFTGGPLSYMPFGNVLSSATALIPRKLFDKIGGYSEIKGLGLEDFEFFVKVLQEGYEINVLPLALYLYEVDRPSMISATPALANINRVLKVIDATKDPSGWNDVISCLAAQHTNTNTENRTLWIDRISQHANHFTSIRESSVNSDDRYRALADYAMEIGAVQMARAWERRLLKNDDQDHPSVSNFTLKDVLEDNSKALYQKQRAINATKNLILSHMGELPQSIHQLMLDLESTFPATQATVTAIDLIVNEHREDISKADARRLGQALMFASLDQRVKKMTVLKIALLLAKLAMDDDLTKEISEAIITIEDEDYRASNSDVRNLVEQSIIPNGFFHYVHWGRHEKRTGFHETLSSLNPISDGDFISLLELVTGSQQGDVEMSYRSHLIPET